MLKYFFVKGLKLNIFHCYSFTILLPLVPFFLYCFSITMVLKFLTSNPCFSFCKLSNCNLNASIVVIVAVLLLLLILDKPPNVILHYYYYQSLLITPNTIEEEGLVPSTYLLIHTIRSRLTITIHSYTKNSTTFYLST